MPGGGFIGRLLSRARTARSVGRIPLFAAFSTAGLSVFGSLSIARIARPGLQYDETLYVYAALGSDAPIFEYRRIGPVPVMLMPYLGALKAFLYAPVFRLFGVSVLSIRLPVILIAGMALVVIWWLARQTLGNYSAAILVALTAPDPVIIYTSRADWGPTVLAMFLKLLALLLLWRCSKRLSVFRISALYLVLLLGIYNKLDFLWFAIGLFVALAIAYPRHVIRAARRHRAVILGPSVVFAGCLALMTITIIAPAASSGGNPTGLAYRVTTIGSLYLDTMDGSKVFNSMTGMSLADPDYANWLLVPTVTTPLIAGLILWRRNLDLGIAAVARMAMFGGVLATVIFFAMVLTPQADGPHHVVALWPLPQLLTVAGFWLLAQLPRPQLRRLAVNAGACVAASAVAVSFLRTDVEYERALGGASELSAPWTSAIYKLSSYLEGYPGAVDEIISTDWGTCNQLFALAASEHRTRYFDLWPAFSTLTPSSDPTRVANVQLWLFGGKTALVVLHGPELWSGGRNFLALISTGISATLVAEIPDDGGRTNFFVYRVIGTRLPTSQVDLGGAQAAMHRAVGASPHGRAPTSGFNR